MFRNFFNGRLLRLIPTFTVTTLLRVMNRDLTENCGSRNGNCKKSVGVGNGRRTTDSIIRKSPKVPKT